MNLPMNNENEYLDDEIESNVNEIQNPTDEPNETISENLDVTTELNENDVLDYILNRQLTSATRLIIESDRIRTEMNQIADLANAESLFDNNNDRQNDETNNDDWGYDDDFEIDTEAILNNPNERLRALERLTGLRNRELRARSHQSGGNPIYMEALGLKQKNKKRNIPEIEFTDYVSLVKSVVENYQNPNYRIQYGSDDMHAYYETMAVHKVDYDESGLRDINYKVPVYGKSFSKLIKNYKMLNKVFKVLSTTRHPEFFSGDINFATCKPDGTIEFLPKNRFSKVEDKMKTDEISGFSETIGRISCKAGKFIQWFLSPSAIQEFNITQKDIEQFSLILKSGDDYYYKTCKIRVVRGEEIKKYYLESNYYNMGYNMGTLNGSCMRYDRTNTFLDLYAKNPDIVSLVVILKDDKVLSRAVLWKVDRYGHVMDRIYYTRDADVEYLKKWAKSREIFVKEHQTSHHCEEFILGTKLYKLKMSITIPNSKFETYPYIDTFKYINTKEGILYNYQDERADGILNSTSGGCSRVNNRREDPSDIVYTSNNVVQNGTFIADTWSDIEGDTQQTEPQMETIRPSDRIVSRPAYGSSRIYENPGTRIYESPGIRVVESDNTYMEGEQPNGQDAV